MVIKGFTRQHLPVCEGSSGLLSIASSCTGGVSLTQGYSGSLTEGMVCWGPLLASFKTLPSAGNPSAYAHDAAGDGNSADAGGDEFHDDDDDEGEDDIRGHGVDDGAGMGAAARGDMSHGSAAQAANIASQVSGKVAGVCWRGNIWWMTATHLSLIGSRLDVSR